MYTKHLEEFLAHGKHLLVLIVGLIPNPVSAGTISCDNSSHACSLLTFVVYPRPASRSGATQFLGQTLR